MKRKCVFAVLAVLAMTGLTSCHGLFSTANGADTLALPDSDGLVLQVARTSKLYTAEYQVHKIVTHDDVQYLTATIAGQKFETPITLGDRKIAIPIDVTLKAYIDFAGFSLDNIERSADGQTLHVTLPDPRVVVTSSKVDHAGIQQFVDLFRSDFTDAEITPIRAWMPCSTWCRRWALSRRLATTLPPCSSPCSHAWAIGRNASW